METVFRVGPADVNYKPTDAVTCFGCGGTFWVEDRTYDWKRDAQGQAPITNAVTWKCATCGRHRQKRVA